MKSVLVQRGLRLEEGGEEEEEEVGEEEEGEDEGEGEGGGSRGGRARKEGVEGLLLSELPLLFSLSAMLLL